MNTARWLVVALTLVALRLLPGCPDIRPEDFTSTSSGDIAVVPEELDFGIVALGEPVQSTLVIHNDGSGDLNVESVALQDGTAGFEVEDLSVVLEQSDFVEVVVTFTPTVLGPASDALLIVSDDPHDPEVVVPAAVVEVVEHPAIEMAWTPTALDFGAVPTAGTEVRVLTITSVGALSLTVHEVELGEDTSDEFEITSEHGETSLPSGEALDVVVAYTPTDAVADQGTLVIRSDDPSVPELSVPMTGELDPSPDIEVVPAELQFGQVALGESVTFEAEIWSLGDGDLEIGSLTLVDLPEFTLATDPSGLSIAPGEFAVVGVTYTPADTTPDLGNIEIPSNDPDEDPAYLTVGGEHEPRPDIDLDPTWIDFGTVDTGVIEQQTVTVSNVGTVDLTVGSPVATGSVEFTVDAPTFPCVIPPGGSESFEVVYAPVDQITDSGEITIDSTDPDDPIVVVGLAGSTIPAPDIDLQPTSLDFGAVTIGLVETLDVTVSNLGTTDLQLGTLLIDGTSEFTIVTDPSGALLVPGDSVVVEVSYAPDGSGTDTAWLEIPCDDPDENPAMLELTGQDALVPNIEVTPASVDFGEVEVGQSLTENLQVSNIGSTPLEVFSIYLTGSSEFSLLTSGLPGTIGSSGYRPVHVTYTPVDDQPDAATLVILSDDPDEPTVEVELAGVNVPLPEIDLSTWTIDFGDVKVMDTVEVGTTIHNLGPGDLEIQGCSLSTTSAFWFAENPTGSVVPPGGSVALGVTFRPDAVGPYSATVTIHSNDLGEPTATVDLLGEGAEPEVWVTPASWDFFTLPVGCEETVEIEIVSNGTVPLTLQHYTFGSTPVGVMTLDATELDDLLNSGADLAAGDALVVEVSFVPVDLAEYEGALVLHSDDPAQPQLEVSLVGEGGVSAYVQDYYVQDAASPTDTFMLTMEPVEETLEVFVNGVELAVGWYYDAGLQSVVFYPNFVPQGGDLIDLVYGTLGSC